MTAGPFPPDHPLAAIADALRPFTETLDLEDGGNLTLTQFPGEPIVRVAHEKAGTRISFGLTPRDVKGLREATGALVLFNATQVQR